MKIFVSIGQVLDSDRASLRGANLHAIDGKIGVAQDLMRISTICRPWKSAIVPYFTPLVATGHNKSSTYYHGSCATSRMAIGMVRK